MIHLEKNTQGVEEVCVRADLDLQGVGVGVVLEDELLEVQERPLVVHTLPDLIHKTNDPTLRQLTGPPQDAYTFNDRPRSTETSME